MGRAKKDIFFSTFVTRRGRDLQERGWRGEKFVVIRIDFKSFNEARTSCTSGRKKRFLQTIANSVALINRVEAKKNVHANWSKNFLYGKFRSSAKGKSGFSFNESQEIFVFK